MGWGVDKTSGIVAFWHAMPDGPHDLQFNLKVKIMDKHSNRIHSPLTYIERSKKLYLMGGYSNLSWLMLFIKAYYYE